MIVQSRFSECIDTCLECATACDACAAACLAEPNVKAMVECIRLDLDSAALCRLAAAMMARGGPFAEDICRLCAEVCDRCGAECARHEAEHCQACAEACRRCAAACRDMARPRNVPREPVAHA